MPCGRTRSRHPAISVFVAERVTVDELFALVRFSADADDRRFDQISGLELMPSGRNRPPGIDLTDPDDALDRDIGCDHRNFNPYHEA